jgi:PAS domain S-box-containing protein
VLFVAKHLAKGTNMSTPDPRGWLGYPVILNYSVTVLSVGAALILTLWLDVNLHAAPVSIFICAVMFSAWFGGYGPGLLATVLAILAFQYYFVPPIYSFAVEIAEIPRAVVFALAAFFVGSLSASQRSTTEALRESEQRFRDYAETASDWDWETGPDHAFNRVSEKLTALGIDPRTRIGVKRWDYATDVEEDPEKWRLHRATLEAHQPFRHFRYRSARTDGSVLHVATSGKPLFDADGRFLGYRGVSSDVTAAVRAEQAEKALHEARAELAHVTRVTTLGEVTASFAHEVNQPLAAIVNNANACLGLLPDGPHDLDEVRDALADIVSDGERASAIIQRVRALAARSPSEKVPLRLEDVVKDVVALAASEAVARRVTIRTEVAADLPVVSGDRVQLQQLLLNLVVNGMDAMGTVHERGRLLEIRGRPEIHDGSLATTISVQDHGIGFDAAQLERLFEAFYTTKPHGMGMGLAISRSIIEMHGGRLWAEANPGLGATFSFSVPAAVSTVPNGD